MQLEAALGDVETSSPVATPVGELPAATTPRPSTKLVNQSHICL